MRKGEIIRARVHSKLANLVDSECVQTGISVSEYVRVSLTEKLERDNKEKISTLLKRAG